jgi:catechol 2,3-dioxygenase-like lactoylglutathione lyase family enzyme
MDMKLELVLLPVSDVDAAKAFYTEKVGFDLDVDHQPSDDSFADFSDLDGNTWVLQEVRRSKSEA